ncbi:MAG TPA: DUF58 domain-containing protein [Pirellulaceae bacterium]|nr:DUF58 domain-containing protein [Pirellulaceae bacterium]
MSGSLHVRLVREGWYYALVLGFIVGGAVLREVNLLLVLAAMLIGPLVFSWRIAVSTVRGLTGERRMANRMHAGDSVLVEVAVTNPRPSLPAWMIVAEDRWRRVERTGVTSDLTYARALVPHVGPSETSDGRYRLTIYRRGRYRTEALRLVTRFPFGLVEATEDLRQSHDILVAPRLGRLTRGWVRLLEADRSGQLRSRHRRGIVEADYYGLREWRSGDSRRWIHWRSSAKIGTLAVLQFEEQQHDDLVMLLDLWQPPPGADSANLSGTSGAAGASTGAGSSGEPGSPAESLSSAGAAGTPGPADDLLGATAGERHVELAVSMAATAVVEACRAGRRVLSLACAGDEVWGQSGAATAHTSEALMTRLAEVEGTSGEHVREAAERLAQLADGGRVVVISTRPRAALPDDVLTALGGGALGNVRYSPPVWIDVSDCAVRDYFELTAEAP